MTAWPVLRLAMAALIAAAVTTQLVVSLSASAAAGRDVATVLANFFSFFTILANTLAVLVLAWAGAASLASPRRARHSAALSLALAATTTYMAITGIVYNALLRGIVLPQGSQPVPWSNEVLHLIAPVFLLLDLVVGTARRRLPWRAVWAILAFPVAWVVYTLVRGPLVTNPATGRPSWYPYPFLDPDGPGGWPAVAAYIAVISVSFVAVGAGAVAITRRRARTTDAAGPPLAGGAAAGG